MLGDIAVEAIVKLINDAKIEKSSNSTDLVKFIRAYKYEKGDKEKGEYIAVNHLPFTHGQNRNIENGIVNVNIHVPQMKSGGVPTKRLKELVYKILCLFPDDLYINGAYYNFYADSRPTLDNDETYYVNLQIQVTYNNLQEEELKNNFKI